MTDIFTTKLTIDSGEPTSGTAATPLVFQSSSPYGNNWSANNKMEFIVDGMSTNAVECGLKLNVFYNRQHQ